MGNIFSSGGLDVEFCGKWTLPLRSPIGTFFVGPCRDVIINYRCTGIDVFFFNERMCGITVSPDFRYLECYGLDFQPNQL